MKNQKIDWKQIKSKKERINKRTCKEREGRKKERVLFDSVDLLSIFVKKKRRSTSKQLQSKWKWSSFFQNVNFKLEKIKVKKELT